MAKGPNATWEFIKRISPCVDVFRHIIQSIEVEFSLSRRSGTHKSPEIIADVARLAEHIAEYRVHSFTPGRVSPIKPVRDSLGEGTKIVRDKVKAFAESLARQQVDPESSADPEEDEDNVEGEGGEGVQLVVPPSHHPSLGAEDVVNELGVIESILEEFEDCADDEEGESN